MLTAADLSFCVSPIQRVLRSAWLEHTPFALFLIRALRPQLVVELGAYTGVSYCAFCQAIAALGLPARAYAIDTWRGDFHCGEYGDSVLAELRPYHHLRYGSFSTLLQSTFDAALPRFRDGTIDLLHIDGQHTYEAVRHDFDSWLPKVSPRGLVLLHDTQVRDREGFGVWRCWEELQSRYPSFEFPHGYGLGLLAVGTEPPPAMAAFFSQDAAGQQHLRDVFREIGRRLQFEFDACKAEAELKALRQSWTWRVGRLTTAPARLLRRLAG